MFGIGANSVRQQPINNHGGSLVTNRLLEQDEVLNRWCTPTFLAATLLTTPALAHEADPAARERLATGDWLDFIWTGAEHMLTGYDHLLFLMGVVFFLSSFIEIVKFITAFTIAHTIVLIGATLAGISVDHHLIDAFIALTVVYKGFENLGGFQALLHMPPPNLLPMVFFFGLVHGFGLSTQLQTLTLAEDPALIAKILWFNVGVELGQIAALCVMLVAINAWRRTYVWDALSRISNLALVFTGFLLFFYQVHGYIHQGGTGEPAAVSDGWHSHDGGPPHRHD